MTAKTSKRTEPDLTAVIGATVIKSTGETLTLRTILGDEVEVEIKTDHLREHLKDEN